MNPKLSVASRYSLQNINPNFYSSITIESGETFLNPVLGTKNLNEQGLVFAPYIMNTGLTYTSIYGLEETSQERAERKREERRKKLERVFKIPSE